MSAPDSSGYKGYEKCPAGYVYVHPHYQNHSFIKGYCRKLSRKEIKSRKKEKAIPPYSQYDYAPLRDYNEILEIENEKDVYNPESLTNPE